MNRLDGKSALISGGARGIGGATAKCMAAAGAKVVIGDVLDEAGEATAAEIRASGGEARYIHLDVTKEADWQAAVDLATASYGGLDILVNNAGLFLGRDHLPAIFRVGGAGAPAGFGNPDRLVAVAVGLHNPALEFQPAEIEPV